MSSTAKEPNFESAKDKKARQVTGAGNQDKTLPYSAHRVPHKMPHNPEKIFESRFVGSMESANAPKRWHWKLAIPVVCFALCAAFQGWEFLAPHKPDVARVRDLFKDVRAGWVADNYMKGQQAVNTTRDYIRASLFFANTAILLSTFVVGYAGGRYADCSSEDDSCNAADWLLVIKLGVLAALLMAIFFVFTQCTRYAVHFSFCINTSEVDGVPMPMALMVKVFNHAHKYYSLGIRLYFATIPVFAWIFTGWALLVVTPLYVFMVRGLENADFVQIELDEMARVKAASPPSSSSPPLPPGAAVAPQTADSKEHAI